MAGVAGLEPDLSPFAKFRKSSPKASKYWSKQVYRLHGIDGGLSQETEGLRTNFVRICQEKREPGDIRSETQKGSSQPFGSAHGFPGEDAWVFVRCDM